MSIEQHASVVLQQATAVPVSADDDEPPSPHSSSRSSQVNQNPSPQVDDDTSHGRRTGILSFVKGTRTDSVDTEKQLETNFTEEPVENAVPSAERGSRLRALFTPRHAVGPPPTYRASFVATLKYTPLNIFLLCVPVSWILHYTHQSAPVVFIFAALGIVPLAALLGLGTEQVALRTSQSVGGLLNATLGNVVELIVAGIALAQCDLDLVQSSLLGGLLSNLLLVLGMAFVVGGYRFHQQEFQPIVAQLNLSLMTLSVITLLVPAAFHEFLSERLQAGEEGPILLQLSRGTSVILLLM